MSNSNWTRRGFLQRSALGAGAVITGEGAIQLLSSTRAWAADFNSDVDVLNYTLTLEYLEATFYEQGNQAGILTSQADKDLFTLIQQDEEAHVKAISDTVTKLGGVPVAKPQVNFPADTFSSRDAFLKLSKTFEETGVGAYLGAAGSIQSKDVLQAAAGIFGVEARHAAAVGYISGAQPEGGIYMGATETAKSKADVLAAVMPFLGGMPGTGFAPANQINEQLLVAGLGGLAGSSLIIAGLRRLAVRKQEQ
ncbi:MAG: ferritin-like domain-containing protein [Candidatus Dormibacteraeota bacterium]|nr:ferritin-like domain-containing protein [Candidatus Dormibacteraeota bacterium]